jgi:hypothetical protein
VRRKKQPKKQQHAAKPKAKKPAAAKPKAKSAALLLLLKVSKNLDQLSHHPNKSQPNHHLSKRQNTETKEDNSGQKTNCQESCTKDSEDSE